MTLENTSNHNAPSLASFSTCDMADCVKDDATLLAQTRFLAQQLQSFGRKKMFFGQAVTVKCYEDNSLVKSTLASAGNGRILVVDAAGSMQRAMLGGQIARSAVENGWAGVLIDGCVRDAQELMVCELGIAAKALCPLPTQRQNQGLCNVAIEFLGVRVFPNEWIYCDLDGIVISPKPLH